MSESWNDKFDYLRGSRALYHNADYWRFLVRDVWRIDLRARRVVDFGCGFGWVGLTLMPLLASGSEYAGLDQSPALIEKGREVFSSLPYRVSFTLGDATAAPFADGEFDIAITHTVLMHLSDPRKALGEMIRVTHDGGLVIACECSRNAINALIHVHETYEQDLVPLSMFQKMNANVRRATGVDYNIGMKMPVLMHQAGLVDVQARVSDAVRLSFPPIDTADKERVFGAICDDGLGNAPSDKESYRQALAELTARGLAEAEAAAELRREMLNDYRNRGRNYHIVQPGLITISYGTVRKTL